MGLFEKLFANRPKPRGDYEGTFRMLNGYVPRFTSWGGGIYESELCRAAINTIATHVSKLHIEIEGSAKPALRTKLKHGPSQFQTWSQFLARAATLYYVHNNLVITPIWDEFDEISGVYTPLPDKCEIVQYDGVPYMRYDFGNGRYAAVEMEYCGIMPRMQYRSDFFGENNMALFPTMEMIHTQNEGIVEGVKSSAHYRFIAKVNNFIKDEDLKKERQRFSEANFTAEDSGLLLFPNTYDQIKQIESKPYVPDADQMAAIKANVYEYFGVNEDILTNHFSSDTWAAFYESVIEPWALQFSEVMTKMLFTFREQSQGNYVMATSNRLQYLSNADKLSVTSAMADRGLMTRNELRELWNLTPLPEPLGSQVPARGEYYNVNEGEENGNDGNSEP